MGCNCKTREEIDRLYEAFGEKKKLPKKPKFKDYIRYYVGNSFLFVLFLCMFPIMFVYILLILFWRESHRLHVKDFDFTRIVSK